MFDWFDDFNATIDEVGLTADRVDAFVNYGYVAIEHFQLMFYALVICIVAIIIMLIVVLRRCKRISDELSYLSLWVKEVAPLDPNRIILTKDSFK